MTLFLTNSGGVDLGISHCLKINSFWSQNFGMLNSICIWRLIFTLNMIFSIQGSNCQRSPGRQENLYASSNALYPLSLLRPMSPLRAMFLSAVQASPSSYNNKPPNAHSQTNQLFLKFTL